MKTYYLDEAATTKPDPQVLKDFLYICENHWYNPSSVYAPAVETKQLLNQSRNIIADYINCSPDEVFFTSGGTEGNNIFTQFAYITSTIEHPSVETESIPAPNDRFYSDSQSFHKIPVNEKGMVNLEILDYICHITRENQTPIINIQFANNEIGTIQDMTDIGYFAQNYHRYFITDAVQAFTQVPINVRQLHLDGMVVSGHKFGALKGTGFIYVSHALQNSSNFLPLFVGGKQENDIRSGTENVAAIYAMANRIKALASNELKRNNAITKTRNQLIKKITNMCIQNNIEFFYNGEDRTKYRLPNNISITFPEVKASDLLALLSEQGIYASAGSACHSGDSKPSHVLLAIGLTPEQAKSTIRFTIGQESTEWTMEELDYIVNTLRICILALKQLER